MFAASALVAAELGTLPSAFSVTVWLLTGCDAQAPLPKRLYVRLPPAGVPLAWPPTAAVSCALAPACSAFVHAVPEVSSMTAVDVDVPAGALNGVTTVCSGVSTLRP